MEDKLQSIFCIEVRKIFETLRPWSLELIIPDDIFLDEVDCPRAQPPQMKQESKTEDNNHLFAIIFIIIFSTFVCVSAIGGLIYIRS